MQLVYVAGVWDLIHVGHLTLLERARALGDRLVVGAPADEVVMADKGLPPVIPLEDRLRMLAALRCVDAALPYYQLEFLTHLSMLRPDILVIGEEWGSAPRHTDALEWVREHGKRVVRLPYTRGVSSTAIRRVAQTANPPD